MTWPTCVWYKIYRVHGGTHELVLLVNDQLDALFPNVFISCLYTFRAASAHHQEGKFVLIHHLV
jgi:hypothetical protein